MKKVLQKDQIFRLKNYSTKRAIGFLTHPMAKYLNSISIKDFKQALVDSKQFKKSQVNKLIPENSLRIIDIVNQADYFYPNSDPNIHKEAKKIIEAVKQTVKDLRDTICLGEFSSIEKDHYPIVITGSGPLAPFYTEIAAIVHGCEVNKATILIFNDDENVGTFNLDSDLHLLQPGFLRKEPHQKFNLPLPSSLVELGILNIPATWKKAQVDIQPDRLGKIRVSCKKNMGMTVLADTVVMSLGLGESVDVIQNDSGSVTSISEISSDGGQKFRTILKSLSGEIVLNVIGNGGAVASTLHVINRVASELRHEGLNKQIKINLWVNLSVGNLHKNESLASHIAWMKNELLDFHLNVSDKDLLIGKDPLEVGTFKVKHSEDREYNIHGTLFHYDFRSYTPHVKEDVFTLYNNSEKVFLDNFGVKNSLAINSAGQANIHAAKAFKNFMDKVISLDLSLNDILLGDEEGAHSLVLEIKPKGTKVTTSRLIIGTTQAIGLLRAWRQDPDLHPRSDLLDIESLLLQLQEGHTKSSQIRHFHAYYFIKENENGSCEIFGGYDFKTIPDKVCFSMPLSMPGAVGVCSNRKVKRFILEK